LVLTKTKNIKIMNTKVIIGGVLGAIVMFLFGYLIYGLLLGTLFPEMFGMEDDGKMEAMSLVWIFIGQLGTGLLLAYIFGQWANISTAMGGLMAALTIGLLMAISFDSFMMAFPDAFVEGRQMTIPSAAIDVIATTLVTMVGGAAIGWYYGRGKEAVTD
jgi:hypothetical protein